MAPEAQIPRPAVRAPARIRAGTRPAAGPRPAFGLRAPPGVGLGRGSSGRRCGVLGQCRCGHQAALPLLSCGCRVGCRSVRQDLGVPGVLGFPDLVVQQRPDLVAVLDEGGVGADVPVTVRSPRSMSTICLSRPGRALSTATRWPRYTASSMPWVMKMMVLPVDRQIRRSSSWSCSRVWASSAANGSSISRMSGS